MLEFAARTEWDLPRTSKRFVQDLLEIRDPRNAARSHLFDLTGQVRGTLHFVCNYLYLIIFFGNTFLGRRNRIDNWMAADFEPKYAKPKSVQDIYAAF